MSLSTPKSPPSESPPSESSESPFFGVTALEVVFLSRGPRHSTTRCLEASRPLDPVRAVLICGHEPNAPVVKRRSIFGGSLGPDDLRSPGQTTTRCLEASRPTSQFEPSCSGGLEPIFFSSVERLLISET